MHAKAKHVKVQLILNIGAATLLTAIAIGAGAWAGAIHPSTRYATSPRPSVEPTATELAVLLARVGLNPETLTAAGVTSQQVAAVVSDARDHATTHAQALREADSAFSLARADVDRLESLIRGGVSQPGDLSALQSARSSLATARIDRATRLDALFDAAVESLDGAAVTTLTTMRAQSTWDLPKATLAHDWNETELLSLRNALAAERTASAWGEQTPPNASSLLAQMRAASAVSLASTRLTANLATVTAAWNAALAE